jgi:hypothetical protein
MGDLSECPLCPATTFMGKDEFEKGGLPPAHRASGPEGGGFSWFAGDEPVM